MKTPACLLALIFALQMPVSAGDKEKPHSFVPKGGFVPNEEAAIQIAVAVWTPIYGKENIAKQKPYTALLKDGVWHVTGQFSKPQVGGVAVAEIQKSDAKILRVSHGK